MKYLIIDTSTNTASIGIGDEEGIIAEHSWDSKNNLSETLLMEIDKLLGAVKTRGGLDGVIAYLGPGSYTGLRVGISTANAFAYSLEIPIAGIKGESFGDEKFELKEMETQDLERLLKEGLKRLGGSKVGDFVTPFYGKEPNVGK